MTLPNALSLIRIALVPLLIFLLLVPNQDHAIYAAGLFVILVLSDWMDGFIARRFKAITTFGKYIDPLADKVLVISALIALVELRAVSSVPVMIIVAREFAVTAFRLVAVKKDLVIAADVLGKWKTAVQMLATGMLIMRWPYGEAVLWISVLLTVISGADYIVRAWKPVFKDK